MPSTGLTSRSDLVGRVSNCEVDRVEPGRKGGGEGVMSLSETLIVGDFDAGELVGEAEGGRGGGVVGEADGRGVK